MTAAPPPDPDDALHPVGRPRQRSASGRVFARMARNVVWVLGGRGFVGITSLFYLAFAARALGIKDNGQFSLVLAYGQAITNIVQFQSSQTVIRYGSIHFAGGERGGLARLFGLTATLDVGGMALGVVLAALGVPVAGWVLGWDTGEQYRTALFSMALLLSSGSTPTGVLSMMNRFDLITYCQAVGPAIRLIGSAIGWIAGAGIEAFLAIWAAAAVVQSLATWIVAFRLPGTRISIGRNAFVRAAQENANIIRFTMMSNLSSTLSAIREPIGVLAVGGAAGAAAAGGYRLASRFSRGMAKAVQPLTRVLFPELARLIASDDRATLKRVTGRIGWALLGLSVLIVVVALLFNHQLMWVMGGKGYKFARILLVLLTVSAAIDLSGSLLEPLLTAHGHAGQVLIARAVGIAVYGALLAGLAATAGAEGVAVAVIGASLAMRIMLQYYARQTVRRATAGVPVAT